MAKEKWIHTTAQLPCPICGKHGNCSIAPRRNSVICHNVKSDYPKNGGWYHTLFKLNRSDLPLEVQNRPFKKLKPADGPFEEAHFTRLPTGHDQYTFCAKMGAQLGVDPRALESLDLRWDESEQSGAFPMMAPDERHYTGISYRHFKTGSKYCAKGGVDGLFIPRDLNTYAGNLVVCEGASDTAAALSLGFRCAIGRTSCRSGVMLVCELCTSRRIRHVYIIPDNDPPTDGAPEGVGIAGAKALAAAIVKLRTEDNKPVEASIIQLPSGIKDLRALLKSKCSATATESVDPKIDDRLEGCESLAKVAPNLPKLDANPT